MSQDADLAAGLDRVVEELSMGPASEEARRGGQRRTRRRRGEEPEDDTPVRLRFVEREGVVLLDDGSLPPHPEDRRRGEDGSRDTPVWECDLGRLGTNQVGEWLSTVDDKLTPKRGLRAFEEGRWVPDPDLSGDGRLLLLIHGTFSHTRTLLDAMEANAEGDDFFAWARKRYDRILTFDHPTLSVSPVVNARELALALRGCPADVDVVCHSRGGLVTRWWLEALDPGPGTRRAVFVGSPLAGTGLAAPPNIRESLSLLTNVGRALGAVTSGIPFLTFVSGVFRVLASVGRLAAKTPVVDAGVALIPGLAAQQRVSNNHELRALRGGVGREAPEGYFAVQADFESEAPGWRFWRYFRKDVAADVGADTIFDGENDLVVDTGSMVELGEVGGTAVGIPEERTLRFAATEGVHHTNYFEQPGTLQFVRDRLS